MFSARFCVCACVRGCVGACVCRLSLVFLAAAGACTLAAITYAQLMELDLKSSEGTRDEHERCRFMFYDDDALTRFWVGTFVLFCSVLSHRVDVGVWLCVWCVVCGWGPIGV